MYPIQELGNVLTYTKEFKIIDDTTEYKRCRVKLHAKGIVERDRILGYEIKTKKQQFCRARQFLVAEIDAKVGGFGIVPPELEGTIVSSHYFLFDVHSERLLPEYLGYYVKTKDFFEQIRAKGSTNYAAIRPKDVLKYLIPLPPLDEQRRIAVKLDSILSKLEEARRLRNGTQAALEIARDLWVMKIFEDLVLAYGLTTIAECPIDLNPENVNPSGIFATNQFKYLDVSSVEQKSGRILALSDIVGVEAPSRARRFMRKGDIVFGAVRPNLKKCIVVDDELDGSICSTGYTIFRPRNDIHSEFLKMQLLSDFFIEQCMEFVTGAHYPAVNDRNMRTLKLVIPPYNEQENVHEKILHFQTQVGDLQYHQSASAKQFAAIQPAILAKAFRGEL